MQYAAPMAQGRISVGNWTSRVHPKCTAVHLVEASRPPHLPDHMSATISNSASKAATGNHNANIRSRAKSTLTTSLSHIGAKDEETKSFGPKPSGREGAHQIVWGEPERVSPLVRRVVIRREEVRPTCGTEAA
eukprot:1747049-Amphidinium_carterae.3